MQQVALFSHPDDYLKRIAELKERVIKTDNKSLLNRLEFLEKDFLRNLEQNKKIK